MSVVFLDASAIIDLLEGDAAAQAAVREVLTMLHRPEDPPDLAVSALSRLECRVRPIRKGDDDGLAKFDAFFADPGLTVVPLANEVVDHATELRARHGLRTPDALQAASALALADEPEFVTGDGDFNRVSALRVHRVTNP